MYFYKIDQSWTPAILTGFIFTWSSEITKPKYLICYLLNSYFLGYKNSLYLAKTFIILQIALWYSQDVIHYSLEGSKANGYTKEHYQEFEKSVICVKNCLLLILGLM